MFMTKIQNNEHVKSIIMKPTAYTKCKIGQDWYKCEFEAKFTPGDCYPDYIEVNSFVMNEIDGKELNIEEATRILYEFLMAYNPQGLEVTNHINGCKTHFDVDVTI